MRIKFWTQVIFMYFDSFDAYFGFVVKSSPLHLLSRNYKPWYSSVKGVDFKGQLSVVVNIESYWCIFYGLKIWRYMDVCYMMVFTTQLAQNCGKSSAEEFDFDLYSDAYWMRIQQKFTPPDCIFALLYICLTILLLLDKLDDTQPAKLQKKQCGGVYFLLYGIAYWMPI